MLDRFPISPTVAQVSSAVGKYHPAALTEEVAPAATIQAISKTGHPHSVLSDKLLDAKVRLHQRLLEEINLSALEKLSEEDTRQHVSTLVAQYLQSDNLALNSQELEDFVSEILNEMTGLGCIEPLLKDPTVGDIMINGHNCVYIERRGMLEQTAVRFRNEAHLLRIINKIVTAIGRRVDEFNRFAMRG